MARRREMIYYPDLRTEIPRARCFHTCEICKKEIEKGMTYSRITTFVIGKGWITIKSHYEHCDDIVWKVFKRKI